MKHWWMPLVAVGVLFSSVGVEALPVKETNRGKESIVAKANTSALEIRVAIARQVDSVPVGSETVAYITDERGKALQTIPQGQGVWFQTKGNSLLVGDRSLPPLVWIQPTRGGAFYLGERWYRGRLLVVVNQNKLLAVNYVDLEHYLYSVVGSEMHPTAHPEALKAQAIAARSYALVHMLRPASPWFNLGNTERWQAYKGMDREFNTTQKAVNETRGMVLSYKGGVVESLYAANDEIVARVHRGRGMSQTGAYKLANQGYDHRQILGFYYPGVQLAKISLD